MEHIYIWKILKKYFEELYVRIYLFIYSYLDVLIQVYINFDKMNYDLFSDHIQLWLSEIHVVYEYELMFKWENNRIDENLIIVI